MKQGGGTRVVSCDIKKGKELNMSSNNSKSIGVGVFDVLGIVFIVLKLVGVIDWSWWLVLLTLYGPLAIILLIAVFVAIADALS